MRVWTALLLMLTIDLLSSCAGMDVRPGARSSFEQGLAFFDQGRYEDAITHFAKAIDLDPDLANAHLYLGRSHLNLGRWLDAVAPLRTALRLSPEDIQKEVVQLLIDALFGAATSEFKRGNLQSSGTLLKEVLELQPQSAQAMQQLIPALLVLGSTFLSQGNLAGAITTYQDVTQFAPQNIDAYLGLARAFLHQGELVNALAAIRDMLRIAPTNLEALSLLRQLQQR